MLSSKGSSPKPQTANLYGLLSGSLLGAVSNSLLPLGFGTPPPLQLVDAPPDSLKFVEYVPYFDLVAAAGNFGLDQPVAEAFSGWLHLPGERLQPDTFALRIQGRSMEPRIPDGSLVLFRGGDALADSRDGRIVLKALNPEFAPIKLNDPDEQNFRVLGEFVRVIPHD